MASGSFTKQVGNRKNTENEYIKVWWESTPDAANNKSKVRAYAKMYRPWYLYVDYNQEIEMWIDGTKYTADRYGWRGKGWTEAYIDKTKTVTHNSDGTKSVYIRVRTQVKAWLREWVGWVDTGSQLCKLDNLARKSSFSLNKTSASIGDTITVNLSRSSSNVRHAITLKIGSTTKTILSKSSDNGSTSSYSYTLSATDILPAMTGKTATAKVTVTTYNGSTSLGSNEKSFTLSIRSSDKPVINSSTGISISVDPISPNTIKDHYIQGKSKAKVVITATPTDSTSGIIKNYKVSVNGGAAISSSSNTITTDTLSKAGTNTISVTATDARGSVSDSVSKTITVESYKVPIISSFVVARCLQDGTLNKSGTYIKVTADYSFSSCSKYNSVVINLSERNILNSDEYAKKHSWNIAAANGTSGTISQIFGTYSVDSSFDFKLTIKDTFNSFGESFAEIGTEELLVDLSPNGVGIGKVVERENALEVGWDSYLANVTLSNNCSLYGEQNDGKQVTLLNLNSNNNLIVGNTQSGSIYVYGDNINIEAKDSLFINGQPFLPKQELWSGTWENKTKIPNADKYSMFLIFVADDIEIHGTVIPAFKHTIGTSTFIRGVGGYVSDTITDYTYHFGAVDNGDGWEIVNCTYNWHGNESEHGTRKTCKVIKIIGLI